MSDLPQGVEAFLKEAGWAGAAIDPIAGDASLRRYFRVEKEAERAMLMYAPPPGEDPGAFLRVADWLTRHQMRAPRIHASAPDAGWILLEDFGDARMRDWLDDNPDGEDAAYSEAIDALARLHRHSAGPFEAYDLGAYWREAQLFVEWYCPAMGLEVDVASFEAAWREVLTPLLIRQRPGVTVLRDYHAENIMLLGDPREGAAQGLIDFQDALVGHRAYDLVSLLQDARRDVSGELEAAMLERYCAQADTDEEFVADYARLGAQRNAKIVGIFARLYKRDGKPRYLGFIPRVWEAMERDLTHPALAPVAAWFDANIRAGLRAAKGGTIA